MTATNKVGIFAVVFGAAYAVIYVISTEVNLPLLTYHPATGDIGLLYQPPGRGPAMYWYGWMLTSLIGASALALIATVVPEPWLQRTLIFGAAGAVLYLAVYTLALAVYEHASVELQFLENRWWSVAVAAAAAAAVSLLVPARWAQRLWPGWAWVVPLGAIAVLTYYLTPYFTR
ncbi:MAG TPA: hypothetical protein VH934_00890 [Xanthobacteraceae bacterium]|jgi:hypothetical protein